MSQEQKPNSGILNPNQWKRPGSKQPDMKGTAKTVCDHCKRETEFELAMWHRGKFSTLAFTERKQAERETAVRKAKAAGLPPPQEAAPAEATNEAADQQANEQQQGDNVIY